MTDESLSNTQHPLEAQPATENHIYNNNPDIPIVNSEHLTVPSASKPDSPPIALNVPASIQNRQSSVPRTQRQPTSGSDAQDEQSFHHADVPASTSVPPIANHNLNILSDISTDVQQILLASVTMILPAWFPYQKRKPDQSSQPLVDQQTTAGVTEHTNDDDANRENSNGYVQTNTDIQLPDNVFRCQSNDSTVADRRHHRVPASTPQPRSVILQNFLQSGI